MGGENETGGGERLGGQRRGEVSDRLTWRRRAEEEDEDQEAEEDEKKEETVVQMDPPLYSSTPSARRERPAYRTTLHISPRDTGYATEEVIMK
jgi:hypothetical protein